VPMQTREQFAETRADLLVEVDKLLEDQ
jgi:hypothetical protein